jgi:thiamine-monophosphate kinase
VISSESITREDIISVADLGEFGLIAAIRAVLPPDPPGVLGIGDDGAVIPAVDGRVVASTDLLIEGRHFRRDWSAATDIGVKAAAQNLADIAAMGAAPTALLFGLAVPGEIAAGWVVAVTEGMAAECLRAGAMIAGGDVTNSDSVMLAITALGNLAGRDPVTRAGARPGEVLAISGPVGESAAGLALMRAGLLPGEDEPDLLRLVIAHQRPQPDYPAGPAAAAAGATSMIDISDGLVADIGHIAEASGVRLDIESARLPGTSALEPAAARLGTDWRQWALAGGEDHALAATFPEVATLPQGWTVIGSARSGAGILVDSKPWSGDAGWDHFRSAGAFAS